MGYNDAIRLLRADRKDIYFTPHLLNVDFQRYLDLMMREGKCRSVFDLDGNQGYQSVFFLEEAGNQVDVFCERKTEIMTFREIAGIHERGLFAPLLTVREDESRGRTRYYLRMSDSDFSLGFQRLANKRDLCVFIMPADLFARVFREGAGRNNFGDFMKYRSANGSIFLLTAGTDDDISSLGIPDSMMPGKEIRWNTFGESQLERMIQRAFICNKWYDSESMRRIQRLLRQYLCESEAEGIGQLDPDLRRKVDRIIGQRAAARSDVFEALRREGNLKYLNSETLKAKNRG